MIEPSPVCSETADLLYRLRGSGLVPIDERHLEHCTACQQAVEIESLFATDRELALAEARDSLPTPETTLHRLVNRERRERERRAFLLLRAMQAVAVVAGLASLLFALRWWAPELTTALADALVSEESVPDSSLWTYLTAGGLVVAVVAFFRHLGGGVEGGE